jgi:hypothetical protein
MTHIFISYSHEDKEYVHKLQIALQKKGFDVWIDKSIGYGAEWPKVIQEKLDECDAFIIVMSKDSYESDMVQNEVTRAREKKKPIFPLLLNGESWITVQAKQYVNATDGSLPPEEFHKQLEKVTSRTKVTPTIIEKKGLLSKRFTLVAAFVCVFFGIGSMLFRDYWFPALLSSSTPTFIAIATSTHIPRLTPTLLSTNTPTITPTPIPTEIIIILSDGSRTSHECPDSAQPALLNTGERVRFEFSTGMTEEDFGKLEWWAFVSASKEKISVGKIAFYSQTNEGGIIYVRLGNVTICTLKIQPTP